jgi:type VI secretion system protein ImpC
MEDMQEIQADRSKTVTLSLLDRIIQEGRMAHDELQQAYAKD